MKGNELIFGDSFASRLGRFLLRPAAAIFGTGVRFRNRMYDSGKLESRKAGIPVISVGNLSVGGTGKTPFTAWLAAKLEISGQRPAVILRGYGNDEPLVHRHLNPGVQVVVDAKRIRGVERAAQAGASVALLDDGFQHRSIARDLDIVLVSAERWNESQRLLPAGEFREPLSALSRAAMIVVTRKSASREHALGVDKALRKRFPRTASAIVLLRPHALVDAAGTEIPLSVLKGATVLVVSAVGDNAAFVAQLKDVGAKAVARSYRDHHHFSASEIARLAKDSASVQYAVCTLKDAVKLWPEWPADARPLWYVSQALVLESGAGALDELLARVTAPQRK